MLEIIAAVGPFIGFVGGFLFGQRSMRVLPYRTERLQVSDRMVVERVVPEPEARAVPVTRETLEDDTVAVPPQYKDLVRSMQGGKS